jgi:glycerophosphoryl diester phosphodiesterase
MTVLTQPWIIAHRGASKEAPDNTLESFRKAIDIGAHCLEVDVHLTRDQIPICCHDFTVGPYCKPIALMTVKELQALDSSIPTLEQLLSLDRGSIELFIELKSEGCLCPKALVKTVLDLCEHYKGFGNPQPFLGSFSAAILKELEGRWSKTVGVTESITEGNALSAYQPQILAIEASLATADYIQSLQQRGFKVWSWTIDDPVKAQSLFHAGINGIITNDPRNILQLI